MAQPKFDLRQSAESELKENGFPTSFSPAVQQQVENLQRSHEPATFGDVADLRETFWSSIDNSASTDLDQIEAAFPAADDSTRILIAIADVDRWVERGSAIDGFASEQATSLYAPGVIFPMLPDALSSGLTSLLPEKDRLAVVVEMVVNADGHVEDTSVFPAMVRNRAQLDYGRVAAWLERRVPLPDSTPELEEQLRLQEEAAQRLRSARRGAGALFFDRVEAVPIVESGKVVAVQSRSRNRATMLIEELMIAANEVMAVTLEKANVPMLQRVVRSPERWPRIVEIAAQHGTQLPQQPDAGALSAFLQKQEQAQPEQYPDLSLSVLKLMGPGEYVVLHPNDQKIGHFGLAAGDYTHSTAPNRRFADLVTQRLMKAMLSKSKPPYEVAELESIAAHCTEREDAARKVQRNMQKRAAAQSLSHRVGQTFRGIVTGVTPKGVFVRLKDPPVDGRLMRGERGVDVGDRVQVTLLSVNPEKGFIDFGR